MTRSEARALATLTAFLLGPAPRETFLAEIENRTTPVVTSKKAFEALERLHRGKPTGCGVLFHSMTSLREEWQAKFGTIDSKEGSDE